MTHANNSTPANSTTITALDYNGMRHGHDAFINSVILKAIDDLGYDALNDEPTLWWVGLTNTSLDAIKHAIGTMPIKKNGKPDARPAMRRIMESLDARDANINMADVVVQFDQVDLADMPEPTIAEVQAVEVDVDTELKELSAEVEKWNDDWVPAWVSE
jgi:hypothetical protein